MHENQTGTAKYTPGPWRTSPVQPWGVETSQGDIQRGDFIRCYGANGTANARLISLAPRMVDALRAALPALEALEGREWREEGGAEVMPEVEEIRAILREIDEE